MHGPRFPAACKRRASRRTDRRDRLAGHGNGLYLLDRQSGPLLGIQSLDTRAADLAHRLDRQSGRELHAICMQRPWPAQTPVLMAWIKANRPEIHARAGRILCAKDVIAWNLTGVQASEVSDMSGAGLLRLPEARYDDDLLALYGLQDMRGLLPPLNQPTTIMGRVTGAAAAATGLTEGTPVAAGYFDVVASALGSGAAGDGAASVVLGSWSINQVFAAQPICDERLFMVSASGPDRFGIMDNSATSAANLEWYVRTLIERGGHADDPFGQVNALVGQAAIAADDPMFHPFLYGGRHGAIGGAGSMAWPAGTTKAICCAPCTKASPSSIAGTWTCLPPQAPRSPRSACRAAARARRIGHR